MRDRLVVLAVVSVVAATPLAAQGNSRHADERYVTRDGMVCREKEKVKKDGRRAYDLKCQDPKVNRTTPVATCVDRDRDRRCDRYENRPNVCLDRNRDGWCDSSRGTVWGDVLDGDKRGDKWEDRSDDRRGDKWGRDGRYPATMPRMIDASNYRRGQTTPEVYQWLGRGPFEVREVERDVFGRPSRASWFDNAGRLVQIWVDNDHDGRADIVRVYEGGRIVRTING